MDNRKGKIVNIDGSERDRGNGKSPRKPKKSIFNKIGPEFLAFVIFFIIFVYIVINFVVYYNKDKVAIYEVQSDNISTNTRYIGIAIRDEQEITSDASGYINYYVHNGKRTTNAGVVFSVDESSTLYSEISENYGVKKLTTDEIKSIKNLIYGYLSDYSALNFSSVSEFKDELSGSIYEIVNDSSIERMYGLKDRETTSSFHVRKSPCSGLVSYYTDDLCNCTFDRLTADMFEAGYNPNRQNLMTKGLISSGDKVYRIVPEQSWEIAVKIPENIYIDFADKQSISFYINDYFQPLNGNIKTVSREDGYYCIIEMNDYLSMFLDDRILEIEFNEGNEGGLKVPHSAICKRNFYLVPLSMFVDNIEKNSRVLYREYYNEQTGLTENEEIELDRYFKVDGYAYIDMSVFNEGDLLINPETGERTHVSLTNSLEGVFLVNKGYFQFVRVEKLRQNSEYAIVKKNTPSGLRLYDHIALDSNDAIDQEIIY